MKLKELFKISTSSLKFKPFRLILTILLTSTAFSLFGLSLVVSSYDKDDALYNTLKSGNVDYLSYRLNAKLERAEYENISFNNESLEVLSNKLNTEFKGVFKSYLTLDFTKNIYDDSLMSSSYYSKSLSGLTSISPSEVESLDYEVYGNYPAKDNEIMLTSYTIDHFLKGGYTYLDSYIPAKEINPTMLLKKPIILDDNEFIISGILDTKVNMHRYGFLKDSKTYDKEEEGMPYKEFQSLKYDSYMNLGFISDQKLNSLEESLADSKGLILKDRLFLDLAYEYTLNDKTEKVSYSPTHITNTSDSNVIFKLKDLEENEAYAPLDFVINYAQNKNIIGKSDDLDFLKNEIIKHQEEIFKDFNLTTSCFYSLNNIMSSRSLPNLKIVGVATEGLLISSSLHYEVANSKLAPYYFAISPLTEDINLKKVVSINNLDDYTLQNQDKEILDLVNSRISLLAKVFKYVGLGSGIFSLLLLYNFISISISYKHKDIGILKSLGSRKYDIHKIFAIESLLIAFIITLISFIAIFILSIYINNSMKMSFNLLINVYYLKFIHLLIVLLLAILSSLLSTIIPLLLLNKKTPLELLKNY